MVGVAQLVEPRIVIPVVAGSIPVTHPTLKNNAMCNSAFNPIKTWADIDEILKANPDLSFDFVQDILLAKLEVENNKLSLYEFSE